MIWFVLFSFFKLKINICPKLLLNKNSLLLIKYFFIFDELYKKNPRKNPTLVCVFFVLFHLYLETQFNVSYCFTAGELKRIIKNQDFLPQYKRLFQIIKIIFHLV